MLELTPHRSKLFELSILTANNRFKLLQILFGKKDGSLYVSFPYFHNSRGIVSIVTVAAGPQQQSRVSLVPGGKVTSHLVKYSHHLSGLAQFSLTGHVQSLVRKQAVPLADAEGHLFTAYIQGLSGFKEAGSKAVARVAKRNRAELVILMTDPRPEAVKVLARFYNLSDLPSKLGSIPVSKAGAEVNFKTSGGGTFTAYLIAPPQGTPIDHRVLVLTADTTDLMESPGASHLVFIGGFDDPKKARDGGQETSFLALKYPAEDYVKLKQVIGSIDLPRK